ncbi:chloride intracellular channel protein 2 [Sceloporus undulatus]|uniref:chloride intracellular channel protein 2 n=1 Tax=Sceloporus undulatus TaxID=8520 RepID=UPI001C4C6BE9|nr:chloride intracellular channel protein 2 [Sceloporus undulatus]
MASRLHNPLKEPEIELFVKAGLDGENIGNCPFCQSLFMVLWLKGVRFNVTTVDMTRKPEELKDLAPGIKPPFLVFNKELKTDFLKIEDFLEQTLSPPKYSISLQNNLCYFHFLPASGCYKKLCLPTDFRCMLYPKRQALHSAVGSSDSDLEKALLKEFKRLDDYLSAPLPEEIDQDSTEEVLVSQRKFLDGNWITLADCNLLPKLNIIKIAAKKYRNFEIPLEMTAVWRYLHNAYARDEFSHTCPADEEIERTYASVAKKMS